MKHSVQVQSFRFRFKVQFVQLHVVSFWLLLILEPEVNVMVDQESLNLFLSIHAPGM